jgi:hypothetical protein
MRTKEELVDIAKGIHGNRYFTNLHVRENDIHLMPTIFMPLSFMEEAELKDLLSQAAVLFADYKDALSRSINGYPIFHAIHYLNAEETKIVFNMIKKLEEAQQAVLEEAL